MICNKSAIHSSDFELESVFYKTAPNQVVVLSLEALESALLLINWIIHVLGISLDVVPNRCTGSGLYFKDEWFSLFINIATVNLRSKE